MDKIFTFLFKKKFIKKLSFEFDKPLKKGERGFIGIMAFIFIGIFLISFSSAATVEGHVYVTVISDPAHADLISYSEDTFICQGWKLQGSGVENMTIRIWNSTGDLIFNETNYTASDQICTANNGIEDYNYSCLNYTFKYSTYGQEDMTWNCEACDNYTGEFAINGHCGISENQTMDSTQCWNNVDNVLFIEPNCVYVIGPGEFLIFNIVLMGMIKFKGKDDGD